MGLMAVNVTRDGALSGDAGLARHLATLPRGAPVIVMVHGYKYDPQVAGRNPHATLFAASPPECGRRVSWAAELGAARAAPLCIGFAWPARGSVWRVWHMAERAALPLAGLLTRIAARGRRTHLIAHSMGARVCLQALAHAPAGSVDRVVLLSGAALRRDAVTAMESDAGAKAEIVNVLSRENTLFDMLTEAMNGLSDVSIGRGMPDVSARWLDLRLDRTATLDGLAERGFAVARPCARVCHWSTYTRPGVFDLYRALLSARPMPLAQLRRATTPTRRTVLAMPPIVRGQTAL